MHCECNKVPHPNEEIYEEEEIETEIDLLTVAVVPWHASLHITAMNSLLVEYFFLKFSTCWHHTRRCLLKPLKAQTRALPAVNAL